MYRPLICFVSLTITQIFPLKSRGRQKCVQKSTFFVSPLTEAAHCSGTVKACPFMILPKTLQLASH